VISAEAQCCVSALTHVAPGNAYYDENMKRNQYSCSSGAKDCLWNGDEYAQPWDDIMKQIQVKRTNGIEYYDIYLNAGLIVGTVSGLIHVIEALQIQYQVKYLVLVHQLHLVCYQVLNVIDLGDIYPENLAEISFLIQFFLKILQERYAFFIFLMIYLIFCQTAYVNIYSNFI
jgi:hypothetical protein